MNPLLNRFASTRFPSGLRTPSSAFSLTGECTRFRLTTNGMSSSSAPRRIWVSCWVAPPYTSTRGNLPEELYKANVDEDAVKYHVRKEVEKIGSQWCAEHLPEFIHEV